MKYFHYILLFAKICHSVNPSKKWVSRLTQCIIYRFIQTLFLLVMVPQDRNVHVCTVYQYALQTKCLLFNTYSMIIRLQTPQWFTFHMCTVAFVTRCHTCTVVQLTRIRTRKCTSSNRGRLVIHVINSSEALDCSVIDSFLDKSFHLI